MPETKIYSFASAMKDFFGSRPGAASVKDFMDELKALDNEDREYFKKLLAGAGYNIQ